MANVVATTQKSIAKKQPKFSVFMSQDNIKALVQQSVGKNAQSFTTAIISAVSNNPALEECTQKTILSACLLGESLKLSPSPQLGQYYLVPFNKKDRYVKGKIKNRANYLISTLYNAALFDCGDE